MAEERVDRFRTSTTEHTDGIQRHLEERLDRVKDEVAELRRVIEQIEVRLRYLDELD